MNKTAGEKGFTTIELVVTLAIAALIMVSVVGAVTKVGPYWRVDESANAVTSTLHGARSEALAGGSEVTVTFDVARNRFTVLDSLAPCGVEFETDGEGKPIKVAKLPEGIHFVDPSDSDTVTCSPPDSFGDTAVAFNSSGLLRSTSTPCYVYVGHPSCDHFRRVKVNVVGTVLVEKWNGTSWE
ncbi:GspH/FimT family pseudopilin [Acidobacteriota bacterium]